LTDDEVAALYAGGLSLRAVAERVGWTMGRTRRVILAAGVPMRGPGPLPVDEPSVRVASRAADVVLAHHGAVARIRMHLAHHDARSMGRPTRERATCLAVLTEVLAMLEAVT